MKDPNGEAWVEWFGNLARTLVRDMLREPVYVSVPMKDNEAWVGPEWLRVGPDDLDETQKQGGA